jgi:Holliday junction resolvase RusA-like endonuclease
VHNEDASVTRILNITPKPQPRENRSDVWNPRPCVAAFRKYKDELREQLKSVDFKLTEVLPDITFVLPFPEKATEKFKRENNWKPHQKKPDLDNILKGFIDCIFNKESSHYDFTELTNDSQIHTFGKIKKIWGTTGQIYIHEKK